MKSPEGAFHDVPDEELETARSMGFEPATEEQYAASKQPVRAALESGVGKGVGMGFLTPVVKKVEAFVEDKPESQVAREMQLREEENPKAALAGQAIGFGGTMLATGGIGGAVAKGVGMGLRGAVIGGAVEGSLLGLGQEVSESALANTPLTAEKLAMAGAQGALTGGAVGGAFHGVMGAVGAGVKKLGATATALEARGASKAVLWNTLVAELPEAKVAQLEAAGLKDTMLELGTKEGLFGSAGKVEKARELANKASAHLQSLSDSAPAGLRQSAADKALAAAEIANALEAKAQYVAAMPGVAAGAVKGAFNYGSLGGAFGHPVAGAAAGALRGGLRAWGAKEVASRGGFLHAAALRTLENSPFKASMANGLRTRLSAMGGLLSAETRMALTQASAAGDDELLAQHGAFSADPQYMANLGLSHEGPEDMAAASERMASLQAVQSASSEIDGALDAAVRGVTGTAPGRKPRPTISETFNFSEKKAALERLSKGDETLMMSVPPEMLQAAPTLSGLTAQTFKRASDFLLSKAPKDPYAALPEALRPKWEPSAADLDRWGRYIAAVERPADVLKGGALSREHVEAMEVVYPRVYEELKSRIYEILGTWEGKKLPYARKLLMSQLFGPRALGMSLDQQKLIQMSQEPSQQPQQGGMSKPDGRQSVDTEKSMQTQSQRMERR